jgi:hypothetical protein
MGEQTQVEGRPVIGKWKKHDDDAEQRQEPKEIPGQRLEQSAQRRRLWPAVAGPLPGQRRQPHMASQDQE